MSKKKIELKVPLFVALDVDEAPDLAGEFRVDQLPTFVVLSPDGEEYDRFTGFLPVSAFIRPTLQARLPRTTSLGLMRWRLITASW